MFRPRSALVLVLVVLIAFTPAFAQEAQKEVQQQEQTPPQPKPATAPAPAPPEQEAPKPTGSRFDVIDSVVTDEIAAGSVPGAVVLIGHNGQVVYRKAFGNRSLEPTVEPMTEDTIFDLASLTKCLATTLSVMRLVQLGQVRINDPVAKYIPEFARNGKEDITVRMLLTHYSGLRGDLDLDTMWQGYDEALRRAYDEKPVVPPGSRFIYSDINFIMLGELVHRVSHMPLDKYADAHFYRLLGLTHTSFNPPEEWRPNIAPTEYENAELHTAVGIVATSGTGLGAMLRGVVHDPTARRMGGVAGHAGLFSNADDLSKIAQALLDKKLLSPWIIEKMTTPETPPNSTIIRGFGWDIDSPLSSNRGELLPIGSYGHTGFTGTSLWIDPVTKTYIIILTNGVHPRGQGTAVSLRSRVATAVAAVLDLNPTEEQNMRLAAITGYNELIAGMRRVYSRNGAVLNGVDVLEASKFEALRRIRGRGPNGARMIGILTNQTGITLDGRRTIDVLAHAPGVKVAAIFAPEHGAIGKLDTTNVGDTRDPATGVTVYSVYGATDASRRPSLSVLKKLDAVVIDIQDAGVRYYTYETTMGYFLEAAAKAGIDVVVLDRPNPVTGSAVQGPVSDADKLNFVDYHRIPTRHGMTMGELAKLFNTERNINAKLTVVPMEGWVRGDWFDATSLTWVNPSPNLRDLTQGALYTGVALVEGTNVSVGRGTDTPFEVLGAPYIRGRELADYLNNRYIAGVRFVPIAFTPTSNRFANQVCAGVNIVLVDRYVLDGPELGIELASALRKLYPRDYKIDEMIEIVGNKHTLAQIVADEDPHRIAEDWRDDLDRFLTTRQKYLIYPENGRSR